MTSDKQMVGVVLALCFISCLLQVTNTASSHEGFGYTEENGPATWGSRYKTCAGMRQSPVNIEAKHCFYNSRLSPLVFKGYWEQRNNYEVKNNGHSVELKFSGKAPTLRGGPLDSMDTYELAQVHFHWGSHGGSEHALHGYLYGMEAHLVHFKQEYGSVANATSMSDGLAVVGLLMTATSKNNQELTGLVAALKKVQESGSVASVPEDAMWWLRKYLDTDHYFTYQGSLTTPPCTEIVTWIVLRNPASVGMQQIGEFQKLKGADGEPIMENARPTQPLNERKVYSYYKRDYEGKEDDHDYHY